MKKAIIPLIIIIVLIAITIIAITNNSNKTNNKVENNVVSQKENNIINDMQNKIEEKENEKNSTSNNNKVLIAYFSLPETTGDAKEDSTIAINGETVGNTQYVANLIQKKLNTDVFRIEPVKQYNISNHQELIDDAKEEQNNDARPEIKNKISNFENYDTIFIGYPIWWSNLPQILYTFLESYDFSNKNVYLFSTNGGSGLAGTVNTITKKLDKANVNQNAFTLYRDNMEKAPSEVNKWLNNLGF